MGAFLLAPAGGWVGQPGHRVPQLQGKLAVVLGEGGSLEVFVRGEEGEGLRQVVWRPVPAPLGEMALARGWVLLCGAAVGWGGQVLVLPDPGGVGKTTAFVAASLAGWAPLSDDLVRLVSSPPASPRVVGFPRGAGPRVPRRGAGAAAGCGVGMEGERRLSRVSPLEAAAVGPVGGPGTAGQRRAAMCGFRPGGGLRPDFFVGAAA